MAVIELCVINHTKFYYLLEKTYLNHQHQLTLEYITMYFLQQQK